MYYDFGIRLLLEIMVHKQWKCAKSINLSKWVLIFLLKEDGFLSKDINKLRKSLV